ncbi:unnamed protein product [Effrenium voratum]|nr:unnamed protein product [Effrenium voratum]
MQRFRALHSCNQLCKKLELSPLTALAPPPVRHISGISRRQDIRASAPAVPPAQMARGRLPERTDAPQSQAALAQRQRETVTPEDLLLTAKDASKKILFVGECTHLFTAAAAKLVTQKLPGLELNWTSTELCWPSGLEVELKRTVEWLRRPVG